MIDKENVKIIRLLTDEIIAEIIDQDNTTVTVKNPLRIVVIPNKTDPKNPSVGFAPYCEWIKNEELILSQTAVVFIGDPIDVFLKQYITQFSGLIVPDTQIIT